MRNGVENGSFGSSADSLEMARRGNKDKRAASVPTTVARPISSFPKRKCLLLCLTMGLSLRLLRRAGFDHDSEFTAAKRSLIQGDDLRNSCTPKLGEIPREGIRGANCAPRSASSLGMTISGARSPVDSAFPESRKTSRDSTGVQKPDLIGYSLTRRAWRAPYRFRR